jgi:hypothetical protein
VGRDPRWDFLYDRQKQPVKSFILERFTAELADELRRGEPSEVALRLAIELARLDLAREWDRLEARLDEATAAGPLRDEARALGRRIAESCLELKERAEAARFTREELAQALRLLEQRLFRVTSS